MLIRSSQKRSLRLALVATAATFVTAGAALAQDDGTEVGEVVVTARHYVPTTNTSATKAEVPLIETPASISVITRDQIDVLNMVNLQQAMRYTAGTTGETFGVDSRFDWLTVRGFRPVEFIDGIQAPVGSVSTVGLDLWAAGSVEVLKGPAGTLYGATPPGGIVNVTTRRPESETHGEFQALAGTFNLYQGAADITGSLSGDGKLNGRLTALYRQSDTQITGADTKRSYVAPAVTWNISDDTHWTLLGFYQKDENHGGDGGFLPAQGTLLPNPNGRIPVKTNVGEPGYNFFGRELYGAGWEYSHRINDSLTFVQDLKYMRQNENFVSVFGGGLQSDLRTLNRSVFLFPEDIRNFGVDTRLQIKASTGMVEHTALIGVDYLDSKNTTDFGFGFFTAPTLDVFHPVYGGAVPTPATFNSLDTNSEQTGVYAQDTMKIDRWRITFNARQDRLRGPVDDSAFTWRAGANYIFNSGLAPYVAYSTSFQPNSGAPFGGTSFNPTTGNQVEAGLKFEPHHLPRSIKWFASAAVYQLVQDDVLKADPGHLFFSLQSGQVKVKGLELESVSRWRERLTINAAYSYTDTEVTRSTVAAGDLHKQLPQVPKSKASLLVDYTVQDGSMAGLGGGVGVRYLGSTYGDAGNTLKSEAETLTDLLVHYDLKSKWRIALNANNVFDKVYVQSCSDLNTCFYSQRRTVLVTLGHKW